MDKKTIIIANILNLIAIVLIIIYIFFSRRNISNYYLGISGDIWYMLLLISISVLMLLSFKYEKNFKYGFVITILLGLLAFYTSFMAIFIITATMAGFKG